MGTRYGTSRYPPRKKARLLASAASPTSVASANFPTNHPCGLVVNISYLSTTYLPCCPLACRCARPGRACSAFDRRGLGSCSPLQDVHAAQAASRWTTWRKPNEAVTSSQKSTTSGTLDASASQRSRRRKLNRRTQSSSSCSALARSRHRRADIAEHTNTHIVYTHLLQLICYATKDELRSPKHRKTGGSRSRPKPPISHHPRWVAGSGAGST